MIDRRDFLRRSALASMAMAGIGGTSIRSLEAALPRSGFGKAKRVIWLHMAGGPSPLDLFDPKPALKKYNGQDCPAEYLQKERFAFIKGTPKLLESPYSFKQHGESGQWISELLPHTAGISDKLTVVRSLHTTQFNHAPAQIFMATGHAFLGRPSMGSWLSWGLGSLDRDLPAYAVLLSGQFLPSGGSSCWSNGFLPSQHQGVRLMKGKDPVLFLSNPEGTDREQRRRTLDVLNNLNRERFQVHGDPDTLARVDQYELAFRMQEKFPILSDLSPESKETLDLYGVEADKPSFAANCLLARRLAESGVRFVQLFDWGWDSHGTGTNDDLITSLPNQCRRTDKACAALILDLEQRGLLEDTIVIWGGEFGRTPMNEERNGSTFLGRDHHPHAFTMWMAGGGFREGVSYGSTDELGYLIDQNPMEIHDLHATMLHLLGIEHESFTYFHQGRNFRLTDVAGEVVADILA